MGEIPANQNGTHDTLDQLETITAGPQLLGIKVEALSTQAHSRASLGSAAVRIRTKTHSSLDKPLVSLKIMDGDPSQPEKIEVRH